ncbi:hypothetical protein WDU94_015056 [Cyamophila willieti]
MSRRGHDNRYQMKNKTEHVTNNTRRQCEIKRICDSHNVLPSLISDCPHCQKILRKLNGQGDSKGFIKDKLKPFIHNYAKLFCNEQFLAGIFEQNARHVQHSNKELKNHKHHSRTHQNNSKLKRSKIYRNCNKDKTIYGNVKVDPWTYGDCETSSGNGKFGNYYESGDTDNEYFKRQEIEQKTRERISHESCINQSTDSLEAISNGIYRKPSPLPERNTVSERKKSPKLKKLWSKSMEQNNKENRCQKSDQLHHKVDVNYQMNKQEEFVPEIPELLIISSGTEDDTGDYSNSLSDQIYDFDKETIKENGEEVKDNGVEMKPNEGEIKVQDEHEILEKYKSTDGQERPVKTDKHEDEKTLQLEMCKMDNIDNMPTPKAIPSFKCSQTMNPEVVQETIDCSGQNKEPQPFFLNQNLNEPTAGQQLTQKIMNDMHSYQKQFVWTQSDCQKYNKSYINDNRVPDNNRRGPNYQPQMKPLFNLKNMYCPQCPTYDFSTSNPGYSSEMKNINYFQSDVTTFLTNPQRFLTNPPVNCYIKDSYPQSRDCYNKDSYPQSIRDCYNKDRYPQSRDYRHILDNNRFKSTQRKAILESITKNSPIRCEYKYADRPFEERLTVNTVGHNRMYQNNIPGTKKPFDSTVTSTNYNATSTQDEAFFSSFKTSFSFTPDSSDVKRVILENNEKGNKPLVRNLAKSESYIRFARSEPSSFKFKSYKFKPVVKPYNLESRKFSNIHFSKSINPMSKPKKADISLILRKYLGHNYKTDKFLLQSKNNKHYNPGLIKVPPIIGKRRKFLSIKNLRNLVNSKSRSYFSKQGRDKQNINFDHSKSSPKKIYVIERPDCKYKNGHHGDIQENMFQVDKNKKELEDKDFNAKCQRIRDLIDDHRNHNRIVPDINASSLDNLDTGCLRNNKLSISKGPKTETKANLKSRRAKSEKGNKYKIELISFSKNPKVLENVNARETKAAFSKIMSFKCNKQPLLNHPQYYKLKDSFEKIKVCTKEIDEVKKNWKKYELNNDTELFKLERVPKPLEPLLSKIIHPGNLAYTSSSGEYDTSHIQIKVPY